VKTSLDGQVYISARSQVLFNSLAFCRQLSTSILHCFRC
jgi:hypothetical protein